MGTSNLCAALAIGLVGPVSALRATNAVQHGCKQGYTYHEEVGVQYSSSGCYKVFAESLNWTSAKARCEDDAPAGFNGALAAARSQTEQDFLINIAEEQSWGMKFWLAGSSVVDDQREGAWAWGPPYYLDVRFRSTNWTNDRMIVNTVPRGVKGEPEYLNGMALLNGHRGAYAWKISNTTEAHPFICWKQSCPDGKDVLNGLCRSDAYSIMNPAEEEEKVESWIAGVVVIAIFLAVLMVLLALWKFNNPWFVLIITSTTACCQNKKQQARLSKRLSTSSGFGGDTTSEFVPAFSGPDRIGPHRDASGIGGAFIPVEAPLPNPAGPNVENARDPFAPAVDPFSQKPKTPALGALPKMTSMSGGGPLRSGSSMTKRPSFAKP